MLDVWECLAVALPADKMPDLIVIGKRGWESKDVLDRLDAANNVIELSNLTDEQVRSHLRASTALLFPSLVEGYGLPVQEALALKTPVVASDIPVFKELFADVATLLPIKEPQVWVDFIINVMSNPDIAFPNLNYFNKTKTWDDFFTDIYINLTGE
jgi:glycosyltransferase involved in cell wall biosynthesis